MAEKTEVTNSQQTQPDFICSVGDIAAAFGLTERSVQMLTKEKILPRARRGQYNLFFAAQAYVKHLKDRISGNVLIPEQDDLKGRKMKADTEEREAKAALRQIQLAEERKALFRRDEIISQWESRLVEFKSAMLGLPRRVAFQVTDPVLRIQVEEEVHAFVIELLEQYSREGIVPDSRLGEGNLSEGINPAKENKRKRVGRQKQNTDNPNTNAGAVANT